MRLHLRSFILLLPLPLAACSAAADHGETTASTRHAVSATNGAIFGAPADYPAALSADFVAPADFNGDGIPDLAVGCPDDADGANFVAVLVGAGDGSFGPPTTYAVSAPAELVTVDFDADGDIDIIGVGYDGQGPLGIFMLENDGKGAFTRSSHGGSVNWNGAIASADFDGDGRPEIAAPFMDDFDRPVGVKILGAGFAEVASLPLADAGRILTGDFNADAKADILVTLKPEGRMIFFAGQGDGTFAFPSDFPAGTTANALAQGDFNGDGAVDVAVVNTDTVSVMLSDPSFPRGPLFMRPLPSDFGGGRAVNITAADFDRDGLLDLAVGRFGPGVDGASILLGRGDGTFAPPVALSVNKGFAYRVASADLDLDGFVDLVASNPGPGSVTVFLTRP